MNEREHNSPDAELESTELDDPERVTHLSQLNVGDKIVFGDYSEPRTVTELGVRVFGDKRINEETETPIVRVEGDRSNSKVHILAHRIDRLGPDGPKVEEMDEIVAVEENEFNRGGKVGSVDVVRTHVAGSMNRTDGDGERAVVA
ncbi:hypothetical protein DJ71_14540 [Halorubrum sp. E3]|nr:hypothetical protein DJ71_14540 [Halorubrum sp. E3]